MASLRTCDNCDVPVETKKSPLFTMSVWAHDTDQEILVLDLCDNCATKGVANIKAMLKKKKAPNWPGHVHDVKPKSKKK